jgi:hypothetical protein
MSYTRWFVQAFQLEKCCPGWWNLFVIVFFRKTLHLRSMLRFSESCANTSYMVWRMRNRLYSFTFLS